MQPADTSFDGLAFSIPYLETTVQIVTQSDQFAPQEITHLAGQTIIVQPGVGYDQQIRVRTRGLTPSPVFTSTRSDMVLEDALSALLQGKAVAAVMMGPLAELARNVYPEKFRVQWTLPSPFRFVWAVRAGQSDLLQAINAYLQQAEYAGLKRSLFEKYFVKARHASQLFHASIPRTPFPSLSQYDRLIARHAEGAGFDWRLVAALIFEESRFHHASQSSAGAYGLMQLMPATASEMGAKNYTDVQENIETGIKYLKRLARMFPHGHPRDRLALVLASYVAGPGHVEDAQRLARALGYDPHCWSESMEVVLPLLEDRAYYRKTLNGYANGKEAVRYANSVMNRYGHYSQTVARDSSPTGKRPAMGRQAASAAG
jgi:membrane-bound lytic murein transglycosylase F